MRSENNLRLGKIKKISGLLRAICMLFMLLCVLGLVQALTGPIFRHGPYWGIGTLWQGYNGVEFKVYSLTVRDRVVAAICFILWFGIAFLCAVQVFRLLNFFSRGEIFTTQSAAQMRRWGIFCVAWGIVKLGYALLPLVLTNSRRMHGVDLSTLIIGLIIVAISWFMEMAAEMREENELTV